MRAPLRFGLATAMLGLLATAPATAKSGNGAGCGRAFSTCASATVSKAAGAVSLASPTTSLMLNLETPWMTAGSGARPISGQAGVVANGPGGGVVVPPPTVTPEPISMTLLATGLVGVGIAGRRRRNKLNSN
jgi:hypothetical protein